MSDRGKLRFAGRSRRAWRVILEGALEIKAPRLTWVFRGVGALDASASSTRHLA